MTNPRKPQPFPWAGDIKDMSQFTTHADGNTGYRAMGEFVSQLILDATASIAQGPDTKLFDEQALLTPLPRSMLPGNYETQHDSCYNGKAFQDIVTSHVSVYMVSILSVRARLSLAWLNVAFVCFALCLYNRRAQFGNLRQYVSSFKYARETFSDSITKSSCERLWQRQFNIHSKIKAQVHLGSVQTFQI